MVQGDSDPDPVAQLGSDVPTLHGLRVIVQGRGPEASTGVNRNPGLGRRPDAPAQNHRGAAWDPERRPRAPRSGLATAPTTTRALHLPAPHTTGDAPAGPAPRAWQVLVVIGGFAPAPPQAAPLHAAAALRAAWTRRATFFGKQHLIYSYTESMFFLEIHCSI